MTMLNRPDEIWTLNPQGEDLQAGAWYAAITLPWTFDRMMKGTTSKSMQRRALNIAKGVVAQKTLLREFNRRDIPAPEQEKSYRDDDLFDFRVEIDGNESRLDVKSINYYTNYNALGREEFSPDLIINNASYPGPDWRRFFPMMIPHTQIGQEKDAYCFAISSSIDFRGDIDRDRDAHALTAFPSDDYCAFLSYARLCLAREEATKGVYLRCAYMSDSLFGGDSVTLAILGEWEGAFSKQEVRLKRNKPISNVGPFSCVTSFQISRGDYGLLGRTEWLDISVSRNRLSDPVRNYKRENINIPPDDSLILSSGDFCNLMLPANYTLHFLGWLRKEEFLNRCRRYPAWVWPNDRVDRFANQPWTQITEKDLSSIGRAGFTDCLSERPRQFNAGWLKTSGGRGGNACCYVFPNMHGGGVNETNLYVLPQDLHTMDSLQTEENA